MAPRRAERILGAVGRARSRELGPAARVGVSAGLLLLRPREPLSAEEALTRADLALYAAKGSEQGGVVEYPTGDPEAATRLRVRLAWGRRLQRALEDDAFVLYAQPVVDLRTGQVVARELHLHLHDGDEYVPRDGYAGHALRAGLLERLDRRLLERALAGAPDDGGVLAATVGMAALGDGALAADLADALRGHGISPQRLMLGVADGGDADDRGRAAQAAEALTRLGVRLALEGFGGGPGTPAALRALPFSAIRLDPLFAAAAEATPLDDAVVRQAVELGEAFGLAVIAPGADEPDDVERLRALGVPLAVGAALGPATPLGVGAPALRA